MKAVGHQYGAWQGLAYGLGVGRGKVDGHVGDPGPPGCWLSVEPGDGRGAGAAFDLGEQAAGAGGVDEPGVPPVVHQLPPPGVRVLGEHWSASAGLVDAQDLYWWQWGRQRDPDVFNERVVHDGPVHPVVGCGLGDNPALFGDRVAELDPQPCRQPRAGPYRRQGLGERGPRAQLLLAAPSSLMPDQPQYPCPVRDVTGPGADPTLQGDGEHPAAGACRRGLVRGHDVHHPAAECVRRDAVDREAAQVEQTRGVRYQILLNTGNSRTLRQARGLALIMNTVLTTAMITRSRASYVSALDPSCPVKSEEPLKYEEPLY